MPSHYDIDWSLYDKADKETLRPYIIAHLVAFGGIDMYMSHKKQNR